MYKIREQNNFQNFCLKRKIEIKIPKLFNDVVLKSMLMHYRSSSQSSHLVAPRASDSCLS